ncbi:MAG TPA: hypothetical protein VKV95_05215 [Terriglobia bacterium]|nr:hypothetical protein [Terriglobia bacterium]
MRQTQNDISWVHRLAALAAVAAFCTIVMGTLVSSIGAADLLHSHVNIDRFSWPLLSGGIKYEPAYRILVAGSGLLAAGLAILLWGSAAKRYIKILGVLNGLAGVIQFLLSDIPGSTGQPWGAVAGLTCGAELAFALSVALALFTRTDWRWNEAKMADIASPSFRSLLVFTAGASLIASILGTLTSPSVFPHLLSGSIVTLTSLWAVEIALNKFSSIPGLKIPAILLAELTGLQLFLGIVVHSMVLNARATGLPMPGLIVVKATHAAVGALVLVSSLFATFQAFRYLAPKTARSVIPLPAETKIEAYDPE